MNGINRTSWAIAAIILFLGFSFDLFRQNKAVVEQERTAKLVEKANSLGISTTHGRSRSQARPGSSSDSDAGDTQAIRARLIDMLLSDVDEKQILELMNQMMAMDPDAISGLIMDLRHQADLSEEKKREATSMLLFILAGSNSEKAAMLAHEMREFLKEDFMGNHVLQLSLADWAAADPDMAVDWFRKQMLTNSEAFDDETKSALLAGIASGDPVRAFRELTQLKIEHRSDAISSIMSSAMKNPETRDTAVTALRNAIAAAEDGNDREEMLENGWLAVGESIQGDGFEHARAWLESMDLTKQELAGIAGGLGYYETAEQTGQWITWIEQNLTAEDADLPVRELMGEWTEQDYLAAGNWLATAADGPAKQGAVVAYVEAVSSYEPQVAEQWALTLPAGEQRDEALGVIHQNWPDSDPSGSKAFATRHGLE